MWGSFYQVLITIGNSLQPFFLLAVRLFWGWAFFRTGLGKLMHVDQITVFFKTIGLPFPTFHVYLVGTVELLGGLCLLLGLASRLITIPLIITMVVAYATTEHEAIKALFSNPMLFTQKDPFLFLYASLLVFIFGPGRFSLDYLLRKDRQI